LTRDQRLLVFAPYKKLLVLCVAFLLGACSAQRPDNYPSRPITMIVGYGAGGSTDLAARIIAEDLEKSLGQPVIIENRLGGNGAIGVRAVFTAQPDGYTIGMTSGSILTVLPWTMNLGFDPFELTYLGSALESSYAIWVNADSPWHTIQELVAYAQANPDKLLVANSGGFGIPDIAMAQLSKVAGGFKYRTVPTSGGAEQVLKLLSGDVHAQANSASATMTHYRAGRIRPLLILSPSWPELEKAGVPLSQQLYGFSTRNLSAVVAPPKLDPSIRQKLEAALKKATEDPQTLERLKTTGELIGFLDSRQIRETAAQVQAEQYAIGKALGKAAR